MVYRTVTDATYSLYDQAADLEDAELEIATILFILGLNGETVSSYTIDEIIDAISTVFCFSDQTYIEGSNTYVTYPKTASRDVISKMSYTLKTGVRRAWRRMQLAQGQVE